MAPEKITAMILNVDLKCSCCYKKVKKLFCKFPQIRDQEFDEDKNKVRISVVCCDPEKIRDKLCCKGGKAIQSIEIIDQNKKQKSPPPPPPSQPRPPSPSPPQPPRPPSVCCQECYEGRSGGPCHYGNGKHTPPTPYMCCRECYEGRGGGPCQYGYGRPVPPPPPPGPCHYGYGYHYYAEYRPCYLSRCDCFSEENPHGCAIT